MPETTLHPDHYMSVDRFLLASLTCLPKGWSYGGPHRNAIAFDFTCSRWMDDLAIAEATEGQSPDTLALTFMGKSVLLFGEGTQHSGRYSVRVDGGESLEYNTYCKSGNMRYVQIVAMGLAADTMHTIEITPLLKSGEELRLNSICVSGGCVEH